MPESFAELSQKMSEEREALRSFTLGQPGFSRKEGEKTIDRVNDLCEQLQTLFGTGQHASEVATTVTLARNQIRAARARLLILSRGRSSDARRRCP